MEVRVIGAGRSLERTVTVLLMHCFLTGSGLLLGCDDSSSDQDRAENNASWHRLAAIHTELVFCIDGSCVPSCVAEVCVVNTPPTLDDSRIRRAEPNVFQVLLDGSDPEGDVQSLRWTFVDVATESPHEYDSDGDGIVDRATQIESLDGALVGLSVFRDVLTVAISDGSAEDLTPAAADGMKLELIDSAGNVSESMIVPWSERLTVGLGELCDPTEFESVCEDLLQCDEETSRCVSPLTALCDGELRRLEIGESVEGDLSLGEHLTKAGCGSLGRGPEEIFELRLETETTLTVTLDLPGTLGTDTVLSIRTTCEDQDTELDCNDNINDELRVYASELVLPSLAAGTYYVIVDTARTGGPFEILAYEDE